ncbi:MAG: ZIP family metal transporter [Candidatus Thermoplasmatota archaeon]
MDPWLATLLAIGLVSVVSLAGAATLTLPRLRGHRALLILVAVAAGTLVGDAFFHLLPEAIPAWQERGLAAMGVIIVAGFVAFFALEVAVRARHAHIEFAAPDEHGHHHGEAAGHVHVAPYAWTNLVGDAVHNFLDGAVIATAFLVDTPLGIATTVAVVLHEVPQELGDFAVLLRSGMRPGRALLLNFVSALVSLAGAVLVLALPIDVAVLEAYALPLIVGAFLYIAAADLIPELHHHSKGREAVLILACFLLGVALMYSFLVVEDSGLLSAAVALQP